MIKTNELRFERPSHQDRAFHAGESDDAIGSERNVIKHLLEVRQAKAAHHDACKRSLRPGKSAADPDKPLPSGPTLRGTADVSANRIIASVRLKIVSVGQV